jgi:hypothetical protein
MRSDVDYSNEIIFHNYPKKNEYADEDYRDSLEKLVEVTSGKHRP